MKDTEPHEIQRFFFGHCRMEPAWERFDFAVDVSDVYDLKLAALRAYESVFSGDQATLLDKYNAEDRCVGSLVGVRHAEAFRSRSRCWWLVLTSFWGRGSGDSWLGSVRGICRDGRQVVCN